MMFSLLWQPFLLFYDYMNILVIQTDFQIQHNSKERIFQIIPKE